MKTERPDSRDFWGLSIYYGIVNVTAWLEIHDIANKWEHVDIPNLERVELTGKIKAVFWGG